MSGELKGLVFRLKSIWPHLQITNQNIQRPIPDVVMQFYQHFLSDFENMIAQALGWTQDNSKKGLDPEEIVYLKMQKFNRIFEKASLVFMLGDIYEPIYVRTKNFFGICIHFTEYYSDNFEIPLTDLLKMREETNGLLEEKDQLIVEINEAEMCKVQLLKDNERLKEEIKQTQEKREDYLIKRSRKEREFQEKTKELERLKRHIEEENSLIEQLKAKTKCLVEKRVTEEEYTGLHELYNNLVIEKKSLEDDDVDMEDLLSHENVLLNHYRECQMAIPVTFNVDLINKFIDNEILAEDLENENKNLLAQMALQKSINLHQKIIYEESKNAFTKAQLENEEIKKETEKNFEHLSKDVAQYKESMQLKLKDCSVENKLVKQDILQLEDDLDRLRQHFQQEYLKVAKKEDEVLSKFQEQIKNLCL